VKEEKRDDCIGAQVEEEQGVEAILGSGD